MSVDLSGVRLRDIGPIGILVGLLGLGLIGWGTAELVLEAVSTMAVPAGETWFGFAVMGFVGAIFLGVAWEDASPQFDEACEQCGERVVVNTGTEGADRAVTITAAGAPKRVAIGPLSFVATVQRVERNYCSTECASQDNVAVVASHDVDFPEEDAVGQGEVSD